MGTSDLIEPTLHSCLWPRSDLILSYLTFVWCDRRKGRTTHLEGREADISPALRPPPASCCQAHRHTCLLCDSRCPNHPGGCATAASFPAAFQLLLAVRRVCVWLGLGPISRLRVHTILHTCLVLRSVCTCRSSSVVHFVPHKFQITHAMSADAAAHTQHRHHPHPTTCA